MGGDNGPVEEYQGDVVGAIVHPVHVEVLLLPGRHLGRDSMLELVRSVTCLGQTNFLLESRCRGRRFQSSGNTKRENQEANVGTEQARSGDDEAREDDDCQIHKVHPMKRFIYQERLGRRLKHEIICTEGIAEAELPKASEASHSYSMVQSGSRKSWKRPSTWFSHALGHEPGPCQSSALTGSVSLPDQRWEIFLRSRGRTLFPHEHLCVPNMGPSHAVAQRS